MGQKDPKQSLSTLAGPPADRLDCELIHKGVTTRVAQVLAIPAPWSVGSWLNSRLHSSHPSPLTPLSDEQRTDWSL